MPLVYTFNYIMRTNKLRGRLQTNGHSHYRP